MPIDYSKYPPNWKTEIRPRILKRDRNRCKKCGRRNYAVGYYDEGNWIPAKGNQIIDEIGKYGTLSYPEARKICNMMRESTGEHYIVIVLTIAHLDQDISNNDDDNLAALCQRCHIRHDAPYRLKNKLRK